jgi:hypothetical protein
LIDNNHQKKLLSQINKLIANHVQDEEQLGDIYDLLCRHIGVINKAEKTAVTKLDPDKNEIKRKIIAVDFDGVIHSWVAGTYKGIATELLNPPVPGALEWLTNLVNDDRFFVTIYSVRSKVLGFEEALRQWFLDNGMETEVINKISVSVTKPYAFLYIDDRSWKFNGKFPSANELLSFKTWYENNPTLNKGKL